MIDISYLNKPAILAALYNNARVHGLGFLQAKAGRMTQEHSRCGRAQG